MRLIDADYVTEKLNEINGTAELDKAFEVVENAPTVDVLEQIRDEIDQKQYDFMDDKDYDEGIRFGLMLAYQIIDKYR